MTKGDPDPRGVLAAVGWGIDIGNRIPAGLLPGTRPGVATRMRIYFAGPLFTTAERDFNTALGARLRDGGHEVFLPQDQEINAYDPAKIFRNDVDHVDWSTVVVGIMDGSDPDSGTAWEIGYAYAKGTPIILLRTDFREWGGRTGDAPYNLMLTESATEHIELHAPTLEEAADAVLAALARLEPGAD